MNHDYAHCSGEQYHGGKVEVCPLRDKCRRYILHRDAQRLQLTYVCYLLPESSIADGCPDYWEADPGNNDHDKATLPQIKIS